MANAPGYVINGLKRDELAALNSTLLHELYFASIGGDGQDNNPMSAVLAQDFGSLSVGATSSSRWAKRLPAVRGGSCWFTCHETGALSINTRPSTTRPFPLASRSWRSTCTSMHITSTSARMRWRISTPSCATSTGRPLSSV